MAIPPSGTLTFESISGNLPDAINGLELDIQTLIDKPDPSSTDLFALQKAITEWSLASSTISTVFKTLGDTLKSTLQKIN